MTGEDDVRRVALALPEVTEDEDGFAFKVRGRLPMIDIDELTELLTDAWRAKAPKRLVAEYDGRR